MKNEDKTIDFNGSGLVALPKIVDPRGNLTAVEQLKEVPFEVRRVYWTYDVPAGERRGGHAHKACREMLVAISGSFSVTLDDGCHRRTFHLNRPYQALLIETGIWRTLSNFSSGAVCLVLASDLFSEGDYIRNYNDYKQYAACLK